VQQAIAAARLSFVELNITAVDEGAGKREIMLGGCLQGDARV
jgi:hypothetical protein